MMTVDTQLRNGQSSVHLVAAALQMEQQACGLASSLTAERIYHLPFLMLMLEPKFIGYKC